MKIKRIIVFFVILISIGTINVRAAEPEITATSAAVIDCIDGKILYSKNMNEKLYPASLTKVLTAILVVENCDMHDQITMTETAKNSVEYGYLTSNLKVGETLTVEQMLNLALISSYNDVSNVLAEHVGGSKENFVNMMNKKAKEIGCTNSHFVNSNGAHDENHYSTAHDMALIGKYAMQFSELKEITSRIYYELGATNMYDGTDRIYQTSNELILSGSNNYYKYASGIKTGFTTPAGSCLMGYAEKYDLPLVAVVLKSTTSDSRYEDCIKIFNYAFENNTLRTIAKSGTNLQTLSIKKASSDTKKLNAILEKTIVAVVNDTNKNTSIEPKIQIKDNLKAPIKKGTIIGTVSYEIEGRTYTGNLVAENDVKRNHTVRTFILIFVGLLVAFGSLRILGLYKRKRVLNKMRNK